MEKVETTWVFRPSKLIEKSTWKQRGFFDQRITPKKVRGVETTWIFWPARLHRKKYVETAQMF